MKSIVYILIAIILFLIVYYGSPFYVVDETEQVVLTFLNKPKGKPVTTPGFKVKVPFYKANKLEKNLLEWDGKKDQINTQDKTYLIVDVFGRWRISDPLLFIQRVGKTSSLAQNHLDNILDAATRNLITSNDLIETVRNTNRPMTVEIDSDSSTRDTENDSMGNVINIGRTGITKSIIEQASPKLKELGIELVDLRFRRVNYADEVLIKVYERMIAERRQIAEKHRSEGRADSTRIAGTKEKALKKITSTAYKQVQEIKGEADAEATRIYASAYNRDPEFYSFVKTLDLYKESFDSTSTVIMSTKSDMMKYFKTFKP